MILTGEMWRVWFSQLSTLGILWRDLLFNWLTTQTWILKDGPWPGSKNRLKKNWQLLAYLIRRSQGSHYLYVCIYVVVSLFCVDH